MQSKASPNGSAGSPGWQPALLPGLPFSGKLGQQPVAVPLASLAFRQPCGQSGVSLHWPARGPSVSISASTSARVAVMGTG